jgi:transmembrane sensor
MMNLNNGNKKPPLHLEQAARWQARFAGGRMQTSAAEKTEFQDWLTSSAEHREAWQQLQVMDSDLHLLSALARESDRVLTPGLRHTYRRLGKEIADQHNREKATARRLRFYQQFGAIAATLLVVAVGLLARWEFVEPEPKNHSTAIGEQKNLMLSDGSVVTLNTDSRLAVAITETNRHVYLEKGEAYFKVAKEKDRPFVVSINNRQVKAVGTEFNIKYRKGEAEVIVTEGRVEVAALTHVNPDSNSPLKLQAGDQVLYSRDKMHQNSLDSKQLAASVIWREGLLVFDQRRLIDVIEEVQYYIPQQIVLGQRDIGEELVGGVFETNNLDALIDAIANSLPVHVVRERNVILFTRQPDTHPQYKQSSRH